MTTKMYIWIITGLCAAVLVCAAGGYAVKLWSTTTPPRPAALPPTAFWLRARTPGIQFHRQGDWISCSQVGNLDHCLIAAEHGQPEYEGEFKPVSGAVAVPQQQLRPTYSDVITPWMWSNAEDRLVPLVPLENGETLVPAKSFYEMKRYVERAQHPEVALSPGS